MSAYNLTLTDSQVSAIAWVGGRYEWSDALRGLEVGDNWMEEYEAWDIVEAFEEDMGGGHSPFACALPEFASHLRAFWDGIV